MSGSFADEYWKEAFTDIDKLEKMGAWYVFDSTGYMNIIDSTWLFKIKRFPDVQINKFKARFCARGYQQLEGVDLLITYGPVFQWTTIF